MHRNSRTKPNNLTIEVSGGLETTGFSLIELMIVVGIVGILSAIAVPQFFEFVKQSRRSDAMGDLTKIISQQSLFYGNNGGNYASVVQVLGYTSFGGTTITQSQEGHYSIGMTSCNGGAITANDECIRLTATALSSSTQFKDDTCRAFTINSNGQKISMNDQGIQNNPEICWQ